jgi:hypothetical protein
VDEVKQLFCQIESIVKRSENYVPRNYQTIGGMWTVDTYRKGEVTYRTMDEGYTGVIRAENVEVVNGWKDGKPTIWFKCGGVKELQTVYERLSKLGI